MVLVFLLKTHRAGQGYCWSMAIGDQYWPRTCHWLPFSPSPWSAPFSHSVNSILNSSFLFQARSGLVWSSRPMTLPIYAWSRSSRTSAPRDDALSGSAWAPCWSLSPPSGLPCLISSAPIIRWDAGEKWGTTNNNGNLPNGRRTYNIAPPLPVGRRRRKERLKS